MPVEAAEARHSSEAVEASAAAAKSSSDAIEHTRSEGVGSSDTSDAQKAPAPPASQDTEASVQAILTRASLEEPSEEQSKAAPAPPSPHSQDADVAPSHDQLEPSASSASIPSDSHAASEDVAKAEVPDAATEAAVPAKMPEIPTRADSQPGASKVDTGAPAGADDELQLELANAAMIASRYEEHRSEALDPVAASADAEQEHVEELTSVSAPQQTTSSEDAAAKVPATTSYTLAQSPGSADTHASISDVASSSRSSAATKHGSRQASSSSSVGASSSSRRAFDVSRPIVPTNGPQPLPRSSSSELSTSPDARRSAPASAASALAERTRRVTRRAEGVQPRVPPRWWLPRDTNAPFRKSCAKPMLCCRWTTTRTARMQAPAKTTSTTRPSLAAPAATAVRGVAPCDGLPA